MKKFIAVFLTSAGVLLMSTVAFAFHIEEKQAIAALAHNVEQKATHLHKWAEARSHHFTYREERALGNLHRFAEKARHFHRAVEAWRGGPHLKRDFYRLLNVWYRVDGSFHYFHADRHVYNDYLELRNSLHRLRALAEGSETIDPHHRRNWWESFF